MNQSSAVSLDYGIYCKKILLMFLNLKNRVAFQSPPFASNRMFSSSSSMSYLISISLL